MIKIEIVPGEEWQDGEATDEDPDDPTMTGKKLLLIVWYKDL